MRHSKINGLNSRSTTLRAAIVPTAFLLFVGIVFLVYLLHIDSSNSHTNTSELIKETPFENLHPEFEIAIILMYTMIILQINLKKRILFSYLMLTIRYILNLPK